MDSGQQREVPQISKGFQWKRYMLDILLAFMAVNLLMFLLFTLPFHPRLASILLVLLFLVLWMVHKWGLRTAILTALIACAVLDFLVVPPIFSITVAQAEDGWELLTFLLFVIVLSFSISRLQKRIEKAKQQKQEDSRLYEERLRKQIEEVNRRDHEIDIFYEVVQNIRDTKDLKYQLSNIAQAIKEAYSASGVSSCVFILPNGEGKPSPQVLPAQSTHLSVLSSDEEASVTWVMKRGESVILQNNPLVSHQKGSYLRRVVASNHTHSHSEYGYSYIVPLMSEQKVIGVLRLLIQDDADPRLMVIKDILEMKNDASNIQPELFSKFLNYAASLIKQALIEQALMQQKYLHEELQKRSEELKTAIISSVSHDFHTPITAIKSAASSLLDQEVPWENEVACRYTLETIVSETNWLERLLTKMLDLARIEKGTLELKKELYPIDEIILNTLELGHMRSLIKGRIIDKHVPDTLPPVEVDPILIEQVFVNLLENAIRYTPPESPIEISMHTNNKHMLITVADRGPGIPPIDTEHIFEKFYQVKRILPLNEDRALPAPGTTPANQGSGLGLAVCRGFIKAHGGEIWMKNREGGGAEFQFTLPLRQKEKAG